MRRRRWRRSPAKPDAAEVQDRINVGGMLIGRVGPALQLRYGLAVLLGFFTRFASCSALRSAHCSALDGTHFFTLSV